MLSVFGFPEKLLQPTLPMKACRRNRLMYFNMKQKKYKEKEIFRKSLIKVSQKAFFMCFGKQVCKNVL